MRKTTVSRSEDRRRFSRRRTLRVARFFRPGPTKPTPGDASARARSRALLISLETNDSSRHKTSKSSSKTTSRSFPSEYVTSYTRPKCSCGRVPATVPTLPRTSSSPLVSYTSDSCTVRPTRVTPGSTPGASPGSNGSSASAGASAPASAWDPSPISSPRGGSGSGLNSTLSASGDMPPDGFARAGHDPPASCVVARQIFTSILRMWAGREAPPPDAPEEDADDRTGPTPSSTCDLISSRLRRIASIFLLNLASCDFFRGGMMALRSAHVCCSCTSILYVSTHGRQFPNLESKLKTSKTTSPKSFASVRRLPPQTLPSCVSHTSPSPTRTSWPARRTQSSRPGASPSRRRRTWRTTGRRR